MLLVVFFLGLLTSALALFNTLSCGSKSLFGLALLTVGLGLFSISISLDLFSFIELLLSVLDQLFSELFVSLGLLEELPGKVHRLLRLICLLLSLAGHFTLSFVLSVSFGLLIS